MQKRYMNLYVIRHGETERNVKGLINGHNDGSLTEKGIKQAQEASNKIKDLEIELIFCSPLARAKETCSHVNVNNIDVIYDKRLVERNAGDLDSTTINNIDWDIWYDYTIDFIGNNTEGFRSVYNRIAEFLTWLKLNYNDKNILLVTHGDVFKAIYLYFNPNITMNEIRAYEKKNCEIAKFDL